MNLPRATKPSSVTPGTVIPKRRHLEPPIRRVLAVDAGSRCLRLLLLESHFGKLAVRRQESIDLREEGLVAAEELKSHMQRTVADWGRPPLVLALSQETAASQIVDLSPVPESEAHKLIEAEIAKLGGVNESVLVYDYLPLPGPADSRQRYWVTFCQESDIEARIAQLGLENQDFQEVTTAANALLTAWHATRPGHDDAVLVHVGAQNTTLVAIRGGVGLLATSFPMAGNFLARAIARLAGCTLERAQELQHTTNLLSGEKMLPGFPEIVEDWATELKRQLQEWRGKSFDLTGELVASGGAFEQPGLREFLARKAGLKFEPWPGDAGSGALMPTPGFEIALGAALQALGHSRQASSLLPAGRRLAWKKRLGRQRVEFLNALLLVVCFVALALGCWQKLNLTQEQQALTNKVQAGLHTVQETAAANRELQKNYEELRPLFERQQRTTDILQSLALLQSVRSNQPWWGVLIADQQSYFSAASKGGTNKPVAATVEAELTAGRRDPTDTPPARPGLIAELCVPEDADAARSTLSLVVNSLKWSPIFERVDMLPEELRRNLADTNTIVPGRHFALVMDFAATQFQATVTSKLRPGPAGRAPGHATLPP